MTLLYYNCLLDLHVNTMLCKALLASNDSRSAETVSVDPDATPTAAELWIVAACCYHQTPIKLHSLWKHLQQVLHIPLCSSYSNKWCGIHFQKDVICGEHTYTQGSIHLTTHSLTHQGSLSIQNKSYPSCFCSMSSLTSQNLSV